MAGDSEPGAPAVEVNIQYLSSSNTTTDHSHVILQGKTSFHGGAVDVSWHNQLSGLSGKGLAWTESDCSPFVGCAVPPVYFEVDIPLQYGDNPLAVVVTGGEASGSDSLTITRIGDNTPPTIYQSFPADNEILVDPTTTITVIFDNEEIDPLTLNSNSIKIYDYNGAVVLGSYEIYSILKTVESSNYPGLYCGAGSAIAALGGHVYGLICDWKTAIRLTPDAPLQQETTVLSGQTSVLSGYTYTIFVGATVADIAGNAMANDTYIRFSTGYTVN